MGMSQAVVSPGSRNAPLMQALNACGVSCCVALDERAAAHHALGMALATGKPVAVCCTSGTAALNHGPALAEADRVGLPLISLTADRPVGSDERWESQTLTQSHVHDPHVRASLIWQGESVEFPWGPLAQWLSSGPVHINCPFDEPLYPEKGHEPTASMGAMSDEWNPLPQEGGLRQAPDEEATEALIARLHQAIEHGERILLLGGTQAQTLEPTALDVWSRFAQIAGDNTSGLGAHEDTITALDRWMRGSRRSGMSWEAFQPDVIVSFGAPLLSKALRQALRSAPVDHWHIDSGGRHVQAFEGPHHRVDCPPHTAIVSTAEALANAQVSPAAQSWMAQWRKTEVRLRSQHESSWQEAPWSDLRVHALLHRSLVQHQETHLHLANSTPVRYAQLFVPPTARPPWSNRGVAGIDGCSSTAVGAALAGQNVTLVTGDLGFLYDGNAFLVQPLPTNLRILVIHNGGGGVFRWLDGPQRTGLLESHFEMRNDLELRPLCDLHGLEHQRVDNEADFLAALVSWWALGEAPKVLEVATPPETSAEAYRHYMDAVSA